MQVILLIVGVSLLAVGAIFFLVYAFITFGLVWRSVIIAAVTIACFVAASLLKRNRLRATAEAIAALAVVFVYLDVFAIRANDLFGAASADGLIYWGTALLVSSVGFAVWHRLSGLRLPSIVAFTTFAPAAALIAGGLTSQLDGSLRACVAFLVLAATALLHPLARPRVVERIISLCLALAGLLVAAVTAPWIEPAQDWAPVVGLALVALVALAHVVLLERLALGRPFAVALACLGAVAAAAALIPVGFRIDDSAFGLIVPLVAAAPVTLGLELLARRMPSQVTIAAAWSAATVAGVTLLVVSAGPLLRALIISARGHNRWSIRGGTSLDTQPEHLWAVLALVGVLALAATAWAVGGVLRSRRLVIVSAALGVLVLAVPLTGVLWATVLGWLVLGAAAVVLLTVGRTRAWGRGIRIALVATGLVSLALSYSTSWSSIDTWWYASVGTVVLLVVARAATGVVALRAALLATATVLAFVAIGSEAWHTNERFQGGAGAPVDSTHAVLFLAILLVAVAALASRTLAALETRVLFWLAFLTAGVTVALSILLDLFSSGAALVLPEYTTSVVLGVLFIGVLVLWVWRTGFRPERVAASFALAPLAAWLLDSVARLLGLPEFVLWIAPVVGSLVIAAASLALAGRGHRIARDAGAVIVTAALLISAVTTNADSTWLALLIGGAVALLLAVSRDGLFASASPRKHFGWLALALAFGGLTWTLADHGVRDLEPYLLPLSGALLIVALLSWRSHRTGTAPAFIALGALLVSIVPLGIVSATGPVERTFAVAGVSAALLLAGSLLRSSIYLDVAAAAGAAGVLFAGFARPVALATARVADDATLDLWLAGSLVVLLTAAIAQARTRGSGRGIIAQAAVVVTLALITFIEIPLLREGHFAARALILVAVLSALYVAGMLLERPPFTRLVAWIALALATAVVVAGSVARALDPFEWGTLILAAALLIAGGVMLRRYPDASSWPWIAPGLLVLLLPSLFATFVDQPIWRLVGIGVVCVAAVITGALLKLQAPLIIGSAVVLIHAIRTFSPQIVAVYQATEWWIWAVIGGALIIFVAVTFEKRMRDLRAVGGRLASLR